MSETSVLQNLAGSLESVERLATAGAYVMGISFIIKGLYSLSKYAESKSAMSSQHSIKEPLIYMAVGSMLMYFPSGFAVLMQTSFGYSSVLAYVPLATSNSVLSSLFGQESAIGSSLALLIQVVGVFAFIRGWLLIARSASQGQPPGGTGQGLLHVFGGVLAMNIVGTLQVVNNTLFGG